MNLDEQRRARIRLEEIRNRVAPDNFLQFVLRVLNGPAATVPVRIGLLLGGSMLRGNLMSTTRFAEEVDEGIMSNLDFDIAYFRQQEDSSIADYVSSLKERVGSQVFTRWAEKTEARYVEAVTAMDNYTAQQPPRRAGWTHDTPEVPDDVVEDLLVFTAPATGFSLFAAEIFIAGEGWMDVGDMRVRADRVSAWWIVRPDREPGAPE